MAEWDKKPTKVFSCYDSLRYEKYRLETFIDWPITWLQPSDLAHEGFYYLRKEDHCACVFCRGIVGAWISEDTPRGEHQRHFPHCPFIRGQAVGNVPIAAGKIIERMSISALNSAPKFSGEDKLYHGFKCKQFTQAKRRDFLTYDSRLSSYVGWPERVKQRPAELAEAGFFFCGK